MSNQEKNTILGIETSCDETALAVIETRVIDDIFEYRIIESLIHSQADLHSPYGGVFPNLAKREHEKNLSPLLEEIIEKLRDYPTSNETDQGPVIDTIAVTVGPGLEPALWTGITFAKKLSLEWGVPIIPVNHMEGHIVGSLLESDRPDGKWRKLKTLPLPSVALLISGGHTELVEVTRDEMAKENIGFSYKIIGKTKDDAVGEAFDKTARLLGLPYPGGPHISRLAKEARVDDISSNIKLPRPMINSKDLDFSFSGLKTAVLYAIKKETTSNIKISDTYKKGLAREFEESVADTLGKKLQAGIEKVGAESIIIGGGVSANTYLNNRFNEIAKVNNIPIFTPSKHVSGDNALMIALAGAINKKPLINHEELVAEGTKRLDLQK